MRLMWVVFFAGCAASAPFEPRCLSVHWPSKRDPVLRVSKGGVYRGHDFADVVDATADDPPAQRRIVATQRAVQAGFALFGIGGATWVASLISAAVRVMSGADGFDAPNLGVMATAGSVMFGGVVIAFTASVQRTVGVDRYNERARARGCVAR